MSTQNLVFTLLNKERKLPLNFKLLVTSLLSPSL